MHVSDILESALRTVGQRGTENGYDKGEERSAAAIAKMFNAETGHNLSEADAWRFLICLKRVRLAAQLQNGSDPADTLIDLVAYTALLAECLTPSFSVGRDETDSQKKEPWNVEIKTSDPRVMTAPYELRGLSKTLSVMDLPQGVTFDATGLGREIKNPE